MSDKPALIIVDAQVDFCEDGALPVTGGNAVCTGTSAYLREHRDSYGIVVATKDWHLDPGDHFSDEPDYVDSWPHHCVAGSAGAALHPDVQDALDEGLIDRVLTKGETEAAYSGFEASDQGESMDSILRAAGITDVHVVGLATDHCVKATVNDAQSAGYQATLIHDLAAGVAPETTEAALRDMLARGAGAAHSHEVLERETATSLLARVFGKQTVAAEPSRRPTPHRHHVRPELCGSPTKAPNGKMTGPACQKRVAVGATTCGETGHSIPASRWTRNVSHNAMPVVGMSSPTVEADTIYS